MGTRLSATCSGNGIPWQLLGVVSALFDAMLERRAIRFYVPYSRSLYFIDKGRERGISADLIREFERWVNKKYAKELGKRPLTVRRRRHARQAADRPSRRARRCRGRQHQGHRRAAEGRRLRGPRREGRQRRDPGDRPGLAGDRLDRRPFGQDRAPARGLEPDAEHEGAERALQAGRQARSPSSSTCRDALEDEDMLEMLNAGLLQAVVVDDWKAKMWAPGAAQGEGPRGHRAARRRRWAGRSARTARSSRPS